MKNSCILALCLSQSAAGVNKRFCEVRMDHVLHIMVESALSPPRGGRLTPTGQKVEKIAKIVAPPLFGLIKRDFDMQSVIWVF